MDPYRTQRITAQGDYGIVYLALNENTGEEVSIKQINISPQHTVEMAEHEVSILKRLSAEPKCNEHVLCFRESYSKRSKCREMVMLVSEYLPGVNLREYIMQTKPRNVRDLVVLYYWLLAALKYIHDHGIVHGEVLPKNLLLSPDGHVVFIDFSVAHDMIDELEFENDVQSMGLILAQLAENVAQYVTLPIEITDFLSSIATQNVELEQIQGSLEPLIEKYDSERGEDGELVQY